MNDFKKPLMMLFGEYIFIQARRSSKLNCLTHRLVNGLLFQDFLSTFKIIPMEMWEYNLREKLERELDGSIHYQIGSSPYLAMTGKKGYIQFAVALHKIVRDMHPKGSLDMFY